MSPNGVLTTAQEQSTGGERIFTVEQANQALVLVRKIVTDIVARCHELAACRAKITDLAGAVAQRELAEAFEDQAAQCIDTLRDLHEELLAVGCVLKDWRSGLVDFPALREGRRVWLCWRLGESSVAHWHDLEQGFSGRRAVDAAFAEP